MRKRWGFRVLRWLGFWFIPIKWEEEAELEEEERFLLAMVRCVSFSSCSFGYGIWRRSLPVFAFDWFERRMKHFLRECSSFDFEFPPCPLLFHEAYPSRWRESSGPQFLAYDLWELVDSKKNFGLIYDKLGWGPPEPGVMGWPGFDWLVKSYLYFILL